MLDNILRIGLFVAAISMAAATVWLGYADKIGAAVTTSTLAIGLCVFVFLYRFKRFKGLGFEGELWEQEMEKAAELRRSLKDLAERVAENVYWDLGEGSRIGKREARKVFAIVGRVDDNLAALGMTRAEIEELKQPWHKCIMHDLADSIWKHVETHTKEMARAVGAEIGARPAPGNPEMHAELAALRDRQREIGRFGLELGRLTWRDDYDQVPRLLREAIDTFRWFTPDDRTAIFNHCAEAFQDLEVYSRERVVRRPEVLDP